VFTQFTYRKLKFSCFNFFNFYIAENKLFILLKILQSDNNQSNNSNSSMHLSVAFTEDKLSVPKITDKMFEADAVHNCLMLCCIWIELNYGITSTETHRSLITAGEQLNMHAANQQIVGVKSTSVFSGALRAVNTADVSTDSRPRAVIRRNVMAISCCPDNRLYKSLFTE